MTAENTPTTDHPENRELSQKQKALLLGYIYFKTMVFAFTGGMAAMPALLYEIVRKHKLMKEDEYMEIIALSNSLPGIIGINNGMLTGLRIAGPLGAFAAVFSTVMPAYISMMIVAFLFRQLPQSEIVRGAINGIRAVSIAILLDTGIRLFLRFRKDSFSLLIFFFALSLPLFTPVSAFNTILLSGAIGIIAIRIDRFAAMRKKAAVRKTDE